MSFRINDVTIGTGLSLLFSFVLFYLIPKGIANPVAHDPGAILPRTYPLLIMGLCLIFSLAITIQGWCAERKKKEAGMADSGANQTVRHFLYAALGFLLLFVFCIFAEQIGMFLGVFMLYAVFSFISGERNYIRLIAIDLALVGVLYFFFVRVMGAPVPPGLLEGLI